jgi:hypothetical protein
MAGSNARRHDDARFCIENTAGQGSCRLVARRDRAIIERTNGGGSGGPGDRLGVCLTRSTFRRRLRPSHREGYDRFFGEFDAKIGIDRILRVSISTIPKDRSDSASIDTTKSASAKSTHPFWRLVNDPRFESVPGVVELPNEMATSSLARLVSLRGVDEPRQKRIVPPLELVPPPAKGASRRKR